MRDHGKFTVIERQKFLGDTNNTYETKLLYQELY